MNEDIRISRNSYLEKLKDPRWQKLRLKILERDEWTCQRCFTDQKTLHVHHKYYLPDKDPWDYPEEVLITLCEECHSCEKNTMPLIEQDLLRLIKTKFLSNDLIDISHGFYSLKLLHIPEVVASALNWFLSTPEMQQLMLDKYFNYLNEIKSDLRKSYKRGKTATIKKNRKDKQKEELECG